MMMQAEEPTIINHAKNELMLAQIEETENKKAKSKKTTKM